MTINSTLVYFLFCITSLSIFIGCYGKKDKANTIKKKYTTEEINFFYETAYYSDYSKEIVKKIKKWRDNLNIYVEKNINPGDIEHVEFAVKEINDLKIPISASIVESPKKANCIISFGTRSKIAEKFNLAEQDSIIMGIASTTERDGSIVSASIGIINDGKASAEKRRTIILEEMIQTLGLQGDNYSFLNSIFGSVI